MALDLIDEEPISSTEFENPTGLAGQLAQRHFAQRRRVTLRKHPWNFATRRTLLPALTEAIPFGDYDNWYDLPADFIRVATIGEWGEYFKGEYRIEDNRILIRGVDAILSNGTLPLRYVYDFTNFPKADALFIECLTYEIAIAIVKKLTGSSSERERLRTELADIAPEAYSIDGQDSPPSRINRSKLLEARRGMRSSRARSDRVYF